MYNQIPYMFPGAMMQAAPAASALSNAGNLGSTLGAAKTGVTSLLGKVNWSSILSNAQKTLNVVNQAIPLYYQVKPVFKNIRTLGRIGKEFTKMGNSQATTNSTSTSNVSSEETPNVSQEAETPVTDSAVPEPTFFL